MRSMVFYTIILIFGYFGSNAQSTIMTYNLRFSNPGDNEDYWELRKDELVKMVQYYRPEILGIQEGLYGQVQFIVENMPGYSYIGAGRDDGATKGEFSAILYNHHLWNLVHHETRWLSPTPDIVSKGWDAALERIMTYGVFSHKQTGDTIHVVNTHFDHMGQEARLQSALLINRFLVNKHLTDKKCIVMGDLNCISSDAPVVELKRYLSYSYDVSGVYGPAGTFNGFDPSKVPDKIIDYIFTKNIRVHSTRIVDDRRMNQRFLSDHFPVLVKVDW